MRYVLAITFFASLFSCSKQMPFPVTYTDYYGPSVISFVDKEYIFNTADRFEYVFFSDDISSSKYGYGNYLVEGGQLVLNFTEEVVEPKSTVESRERSAADSSYNQYIIVATSPSGTNLEGVSVLLTDLEGNYLTGATTDSYGRAEITWTKGSPPILLKLSSLGYASLDYTITSGRSQHFVATLVERNVGTRIINQQWKKRIRFRKDALVIDGEKFIRKTVANEN